MSTIELPEDAAALAAAATEGEATEVVLIVELVSTAEPDELDVIIGIGASGRSDPFDIHAERATTVAERDSATI